MTSRLAAALLLGALGGACRHPAPGDAPPAVLRVALAPEMESLDPHEQMHGGQAVLCNVYEGLVGFDAQMRVVPALAERWESPDELTWRFHLRRHVRFHDGGSLRAEDVVKSLREALRPGLGGSELAIVKDVRALSEDVVELRTRRPYPMLLNSLVSGFVVRRVSGQPPLGTGPYRVTSFDPRRGLDLEAWAGADRPPSEKRVRFVFEADPARRLALLERGEVDIALRLPEDARLRPGAGYRLVSVSAPAARVLALRADRPPFADPRVRRAVSLAIDRAAIARDLLGGRAQPLGQLLPQGIFGHVPGLAAPARDLLAAQALVAASGGHGPAARLAHGRGRDREAELITLQLGEAGLRVAPVSMDVAALKSSLDSGQASMLLWSCVYYTGDATDLFETMLHSRESARGYGADNISSFADPVADRLIEEAGRTPDLHGRQLLFQQAMRRVLVDGPLIPLWEVPWVSGVGTGVAWTPASHGWFVAADVRRTPTP